MDMFVNQLGNGWSSMPFAPSSYFTDPNQSALFSNYGAFGSPMFSSTYDPYSAGAFSGGMDWSSYLGGSSPLFSSYGGSSAYPSLSSYFPSGDTSQSNLNYYGAGSQAPIQGTENYMGWNGPMPWSVTNPTPSSLSQYPGMPSTSTKGMTSG